MMVTTANIRALLLPGVRMKLGAKWTLEVRFEDGAFFLIRLHTGERFQLFTADDIDSNLYRFDFLSRLFAINEAIGHLPPKSQPDIRDADARS